MQLPNDSNSSIVFLLGTQRSGTTWLANIFDASPHTLLFMEPFAPAYSLFPQFPEPSLFMKQSSPALDKFLRQEALDRLLKYKSLFFPCSVTASTWFRVDMFLSRLISKFGIFVPQFLFDRTRKFNLLNLNRTDRNYPVFHKEALPSTWVIKELRLAGKIPVLRSAYPQARFVVIIRHPAATVHSIMSWFQRHRLGELRQVLDTYLERIEVQIVAEPYRLLIERCRAGDLVHKVALYWRISYETLHNALKDDPLAPFIVYEKLAARPLETAEMLFSQLDIPWSNSVADYINHSTNTSLEKVTAITTVRDSTRAYRDWCDKISPETLRAVEEITGDSYLSDLFEPYY